MYDIIENFQTAANWAAKTGKIGNSHMYIYNIHETVVILHKYACTYLYTCGMETVTQKFDNKLCSIFTHHSRDNIDNGDGNQVQVQETAINICIACCAHRQD